jgi:hypothetical protein
MSRHFILYTSDAHLPDEPAERLMQLCDILSRARRHNNANQVNGYLALVGNQFIQILEGDSVVLSAIMLRIGIDHRHANLVVREKGKVTTPLFNDWEMGCCTEPHVLRHALERAGLAATDDLSKASSEALKVFLVTLSWLAKTSGEECVA